MLCEYQKIHTKYHYKHSIGHDYRMNLRHESSSQSKVRNGNKIL